MFTLKKNTLNTWESSIFLVINTSWRNAFVFHIFDFCQHGHFNAKYLEKCLGDHGDPPCKTF